MLYNESLLPMVGSRKHPHALGQPAAVVLAEIWSIIEPLLRHVRTTGEATWSEDLMLPLARTGAPEESYFTFTYSPIRDESSGVGGVFCAVVETTDKVIEERRLRLLNALAEGRRAGSATDACLHAASEIQQAQKDVPFALFYLFDVAGVAVLVATANIPTGSAFAPALVRRGEDGPWLFDDAAGETRVVPLADGPAGDGRIVRWFGSNTNIDERRRNDDFRETFVGVLGHDLRNPLNTVLMTSRVLAMLPTTPDAIRKKLERVTSSGVRMQRMIEQLLDLTRARLTDGIPLTLSTEPVDLGALLTKIVDEIGEGQPNCRFELDVQGLCTARVDPDRLEQVMSNLLGNAVAHGDQTQPIRVVLHCEADWASLAVHNHGSPIPTDFLPLLFNPFAREQASRRPSAGLGLGLYISERIVAAHGGTLSVQSSEAAGTRFTVRLPRRQQ